MDFRLTEDQQLLDDSVRRFVREEYGFAQRKTLLATDEGFSRAHWRRFAELGWLGIAVAEAKGGFGAGLVEQSILLEGFGRGLVLEPYLPTAVLATRLLAASGSAVADEVLQRICAGDAIIALAAHEPGARFELSRVHVRARQTPEGYVLEGTKVLALGGASATHFLVTARLHGESDDPNGMGLFLVDAADALLYRYRTIDGQRATDVSLQQVLLGQERLLLDPASAWEALDEALDRAVLGLCAEAIGCMEAAMEITIEYIKQRNQFGRPLAEFQVLQHRCADMFIHIDATRSLLYRALGTIDGSVRERRRAVSMCKVRVAEAGKVVGGDAVHLHGGNGMTDEYAVGHYLRRLTLIEKSYGDTEHHLERCLANEELTEAG
jgi:alkylation response protein AidB-like acyl-CoA dehydrogenase